MSEPQETVEENYDVFIVYTICDLAIEEEVKAMLKRQGLRVTSQEDDKNFKPGEPIFGHVARLVNTSTITLIILTSESHRNEWILLETILAAEKSIREGKMALRVLYKDLGETHIGKLKKGLLEKVPDMAYNNVPDLERKLANFVKEEIPVIDLLPVGCYAHAQIFSHFTGLLQYILPDFKQWLISEVERQEIPLEKVSTKYFILMPTSCKIRSSLESAENGIVVKHAGSVTKIVIHAGKERKICLTLYSVTKGSEIYYFVADIPNVLDSIYKLNKRELADVDLKYQTARFYFTMNELLNHGQNKACSDVVEMIMYHDSRQSIPEVMFREVQKCVAQQNTQSGSINAEEDKTQVRSTLRLISNIEKREFDAFISCADDTKSQEVAEIIEKFLVGKGKKVAREKPNIPELQQLNQMLEKSDWIIFVISEEFLDVKTFHCKSALSACINENSLRILPVLVDGVAVKKLPSYLKFITYVSISEPKYCEHIYQKLNGEPVTMDQKLPCGDVATGLAWAYVINYLVHTLLEKDFRERIQDFLQKNGIKEGCIKKMFVVAPKTCTVQDSIPKQANQGSTHSSVEFLGEIAPVEMDTGGQKKRKYYLNMYRHTNQQTGQSVCFICEYATPFKCLHDMAHKYPFAGLEKDDMFKQADEFVQKTRDIINRKAVKAKVGDVSSLVDFFEYDDSTESRESLMGAIEQKLNQEIRGTCIYQRENLSKP